MANTKISGLTALTGANVEHEADSMPIVDDSVTATKRIVVSELIKGIEVLGTKQATTSGTEVDFTGIPAWAKKITVMFNGTSLTTDDDLLVQIGDSGGIEATGYTSTAVYLQDAGGSDVTNTNTISATDGFNIATNDAGDAVTGHMLLTLMNASTNKWIASHRVSKGAAVETAWGSGSKSLSGTLDRVRITGGTFDAGSVNVMWE